MEVELRAKVKNSKDIEKKLQTLGAIRVGESEISDYYFGSIDLYENIGHSFWIRIRKKGEKLQLAYKGSTGVDGVYEEYEQNLQDLDTALNIFTKMGLSNEITVHKKRISYKYKDISLEIDIFKDWGTFIEAEIISDKSGKTELFDLFEELGIEKKNIFEKGYITLKLQEQKSPFTKWIKN